MIKLDILLFCLLEANLTSQQKLIFNTESAESLLLWMEEGCNKDKTNDLTSKAGTQIMEELLKMHEKNISQYNDALKEFNYQDTLSENVYLLNEAYNNQKEIRNILNEIKCSDFSKEVYSQTIKYFPDDFILPRNYEVFFTATGWKWGDAMSFNYKNNNGKYNISEEGIPAIIINLTIVCMTYGDTLKERMNTLKDVMTHEFFHAIFSDYIKNNWHSWNNKNIENNMLHLMLNEGIAHYISDGKLLQENYNKDDKLKQKEKEAFISLRENIKTIFDISKKDEERKMSLEAGLIGKYWEKYVCITGLFIAYHIEQFYGINELIESVKNGPIYFIKKYEEIRQNKPELCYLPDEIIKIAT